MMHSILFQWQSTSGRFKLVKKKLQNIKAANEKYFKKQYMPYYGELDTILLSYR